MPGGQNKSKKTNDTQEVKVPKLSILLGLLVLIGLIVFVYYHVGDATRFVSLLKKAKPQWLLLAIGLQLLTYLCVGMIWRQVTRDAGYNVSLTSLATMSIEKLSIDQLIPALGLSGNLVVYRTMKRLDLPKSLAMEAILINILAHYIAYALVTVAVVAALVFMHDITHVIIILVGVFAIILVAVPVVILWLLSNKNKELPSWLFKFKPLAKAKEVIKSVSAEQVYSPKLLLIASLFNLFIFLLDSSTLWAALQSICISVSFLTAFIALVMASIASTLSALPGGLGGFEAGAVAMLTLMGVPIEAALAGTLILRGLTLWLPLLPGLYFARRDVSIKL